MSQKVFSISPLKSIRLLHTGAQDTPLSADFLAQQPLACDELDVRVMWADSLVTRTVRRQAPGPALEQTARAVDDRDARGTREGVVPSQSPGPRPRTRRPRGRGRRQSKTFGLVRTIMQREILGTSPGGAEAFTMLPRAMRTTPRQRAIEVPVIQLGVRDAEDRGS
jgi:hypothetical protein